MCLLMFDISTTKDCLTRKGHFSLYAFMTTCTAALLFCTAVPTNAQPIDSANPVIPEASPRPSKSFRFFGKLMPAPQRSRDAAEVGPRKDPDRATRRQPVLTATPKKTTTPVLATSDAAPESACPIAPPTTAEKKDIGKWFIAKQPVPETIPAVDKKEINVVVSTAPTPQIDKTLAMIDNEAQLELLPHVVNINQAITNISVAIKTPHPDRETINDQVDFLTAETSLLKNQKDKLPIESWIRLDVIINKFDQGANFIRRGCTNDICDHAMLNLGLERICAAQHSLDAFVTK